MRKLLFAALYRFSRAPLLWVSLLFAFGSGLICGCDLYTEIGNIYLLPNYLLITATVALLVGKEHEYHTLRNKLIAGHTRLHIFLSELIVNGGFAARTALAFELGVAICGAPELSVLPAERLALIAVGFVLSCASLGVLVTTLACLISSRAMSVAVCFVTVLALIGGMYELHHALYWQDPRGIFGFLRPICEVLDIGTPFGQIEYYRDVAKQALSGHLSSAYGMQKAETGAFFSPFCAIGFGALTAGVGYTLFRRKNID